MDIAGTIAEYLLCKKNAVTHDTYKWYAWMLEGVFVKWCAEQGISELAQITPGTVQAFVAAEPGLSPNTKHHRAQVVKGFLKWCSVDDSLGVKGITIARIEMPKVEQPEVQIYNTQEIGKLLNACADTRHNLRNRAILLLLLDTGIRAAELAVDGERMEEQTGLLFNGVVFGNRKEADSYVIVMGKGRKTRTVKFGDETRLALQKYLNRERPRIVSDYFFLASGKVPFTVRSLQQMLDRLGNAAGVQDVHPHKFRHTFAINQLLAGTSSLILMELMGHETLESTKIYTRALTQMQARQASVSVVDEIWKGPRGQRDQAIRVAIKRGKQG